LFRCVHILCQVHHVRNIGMILDNKIQNWDCKKKRESKRGLVV
jgi:hypothetical protein